MPSHNQANRWKYDRPPSLQQFMATFSDDAACAEWLAKRRWPNGFVCPSCGSLKGWNLEAKPWRAAGTSATLWPTRSRMTPSESINAALRIASLLRVAKRDLDDAVALHERNSANASYHLEQAAEKVLLAVCLSEEIHIPRQKAHQLDENILLLPDENPVKA
jgi:hypothetical protein